RTAAPRSVPRGSTPRVSHASARRRTCPAGNVSVEAFSTRAVISAGVTAATATGCANRKSRTDSTSRSILATTAGTVADGRIRFGNGDSFGQSFAISAAADGPATGATDGCGADGVTEGVLPPPEVHAARAARTVAAATRLIATEAGRSPP